MDKFLCVDDEREESNSLVKYLRDAGLDLELSSPKSLEDQLDNIIRNNYDGLLLDLKLDEFPDVTGYRARYMSHSLARLVRDKVIEGEARDIPIVIWSSQPKFRSFFQRDLSGQELYDARYDKALVVDEAEAVIRELTSLSGGYRRIETLRKSGRTGFLEMLGAPQNDVVDLDPRIGEPFETGIFPVSEYARYIRTDVIGQPYPLVDEDLLAARLGIDRRRSETWPAVLAQLCGAQYDGVFNEGWPRWWWDVVNSWWQSIAPGTDLRSMDASGRVSLISAALPIGGLIAPDPIDSGYGTAYWTMCEGYGAPLDPVNGLIANNSSREPWHDARYVSLKALLERVKYEDGLRVHPTDAARYELLSSARS
jgi:CheY-like chemotaxis protein